MRQLWNKHRQCRIVTTKCHIDKFRTLHSQVSLQYWHREQKHCEPDHLSLTCVKKKNSSFYTTEKHKLETKQVSESKKKGKKKVPISNHAYKLKN